MSTWRERGVIRAPVAGPTGIAWTGEYLILASVKSRRLHLLGLPNGLSMGVVSIEADVSGVAGLTWDGESLWAVAEEKEGGKSVILRLDASTGAVQQSFPAPDGQGGGICWAGKGLWLGQFTLRNLYRLAAKDGSMEKVYEMERPVTGIAWRGGVLYFGSQDTMTERCRIDRFDPAKGRSELEYEAPEGVMLLGLEAVGESLWYVDHTEGMVHELVEVN